jgi:hypothetical protein
LKSGILILALAGIKIRIHQLTIDVTSIVISTLQMYQPNPNKSKMDEEQQNLANAREFIKGYLDLL